MKSDGRFKLREVSIEAKKAKRLAKVLDCDHSITILVEEVKNAAETEGIEARATEAEGGGGGGLPGEGRLGFVGER